jgi:hypothetical protein
MYNPPEYPEITVDYYYTPAEFEFGHCMALEEVEISGVRIHEEPISEPLESFLIETFGDKWTEDICTLERKRNKKVRRYYAFAQ